MAQLIFILTRYLLAALWKMDLKNKDQRKGGKGTVQTRNDGNLNKGGCGREYCHDCQQPLSAPDKPLNKSISYNNSNRDKMEKH